MDRSGLRAFFLSCLPGLKGVVVVCYLEFLPAQLGDIYTMVFTTILIGQVDDGGIWHPGSWGKCALSSS